VKALDRRDGIDLPLAPEIAVGGVQCPLLEDRAAA